MFNGVVKGSLPAFLGKKEWTKLLIKKALGNYLLFFIKENGRAYKFYSNVEKEDLDLDGKHKDYIPSIPMPYKGSGTIIKQQEKGIVGLYHNWSVSKKSMYSLFVFDTIYVEYPHGVYFISVETLDDGCPGWRFFESKSEAASIEELIISGKV